MNNRILKSLIMLTVVLSAGCSTVYVPLMDTKIAIERGGGDCKNKSVAYHAALKEQEIESCVTCGVLSFNSTPLLHCWNEVRSPEDGKWKLIDLHAMVGQLDGWDVEQSPEYFPYVRYNGNVTVEDIRFERGYTWKSDKNLGYLMENCQFNWFPIISELKHLSLKPDADIFAFDGHTFSLSQAITPIRRMIQMMMDVEFSQVPHTTSPDYIKRSPEHENITTVAEKSYPTGDKIKLASKSLL
jgi:hypothetical protein